MVQNIFSVWNPCCNNITVMYFSFYLKIILFEKLCLTHTTVIFSFCSWKIISLQIAFFHQYSRNAFLTLWKYLYLQIFYFTNTTATHFSFCKKFFSFQNLCFCNTATHFLFCENSFLCNIFSSSLSHQCSFHFMTKALCSKNFVSTILW